MRHPKWGKSQNLQNLEETGSEFKFMLESYKDNIYIYIYKYERRRKDKLLPHILLEIHANQQGYMVAVLGHQADKQLLSLAHDLASK